MAVRAPAIDPGELGELYSDVLRVARRIVGEKAAEDVAQETFLRLIATREARPRAWLKKVARNLAIDEIRRRRRTTPVDEVPDRAIEGPDVAELLSVRRAVQDLPERDRLLLWLKHVEGRRAADIAEMTGTTTSSVEMRLFRARRALSESYARRAGLLASALAALATVRRFLGRLGSVGTGAKVSVALVAAVTVGTAVGTSSTHVAAPPRVIARSAQARTSQPSGSASSRTTDASGAVVALAPMLTTTVALPIGPVLDDVIVRAGTILAGAVRQVTFSDAQTDYDLRVRHTWYGPAERGASIAFSLPGRPKVFIGSNVMLFLSDADSQQPLAALLVGHDGALYTTDGRPLRMDLQTLEGRMRALRDERTASDGDASDHSGGESGQRQGIGWQQVDPDSLMSGGTPLGRR